MVRIITDSAADFEPHELEQLNIACIPLKVMFGNDEYEENLTLSKDKFYELLLSGSDLPKTSQASPRSCWICSKKPGSRARKPSISAFPPH